MSSMLPLIVLIILAVPVIVIVSLVSLSAKVKELAGHLELLRRNIAQLAVDLSDLKRQQSQTPMPAAPLEQAPEPAAAQSIQAQSWRSPDAVLPLPEVKEELPPLVSSPVPPSP